MFESWKHIKSLVCTFLIMETQKYFKYFPNYIYSIKIFTVEIFLLFFINSFSTIYLSNFEKSTELIHLGALILIWMVPISLYTLYLKYYKNTWDTFELDVSYGDFLLWSVSSILITVSTLYYIFEITQNGRILDILFFSSPVLYSIRIWTLVKLNKSEYKFYVDVGADNEDIWTHASNSLQKSFQLTTKENRVYNVYGLLWCVLSIARYERLKETIDSNTKYTYLGAEKYTKAASTLSQIHLAYIYDKPHTEIHKLTQTFEAHIREANELLQNRKCSSCGDVYTKDNMYYMGLNSSETIYCESCYKVYTEGKSRSKQQKQSYKYEKKKRERRKKRERQKERRRKQNKTQSESKTSESTSSTSSESNKNTEWNSRDKRNTKSDEMTLTKAAEILNVTETSDKDKIKKQYREAVKEAHPDTDGGSEEEFKQVQEAKETLMNQFN